MVGALKGPLPKGRFAVDPEAVLLDKGAGDEPLATGVA
jgi:hypothetical protein